MPQTFGKNTVIFRRTDTLFDEASHDVVRRAKLLRSERRRRAIFGWILILAGLGVIVSAAYAWGNLNAVMEGGMPDADPTSLRGVMEGLTYPCIGLALGSLVGLLVADQRVKMLILLRGLNEREE